MKYINLAHEVLKQRAADGVRGLDRELSRFKCHIKDAGFVQKDVEEITQKDIRAWLRDMAQKNAEGPGERRKLSRQTISRCQSLVSAVFIEAVERELIEVNPCLGVKLKKCVDESDTRVKWAYLTPEEQRLLVACDSIPIEDGL